MAGKGDKPKNCFSREYKNNYELINWGHIPKNWSDFSDKFYEENKDILEPKLKYKKMVEIDEKTNNPIDKLNNSI